MGKVWVSRSCQDTGPISSLAIPMMTLCVIEQLKTMDPSLNYDDLTDWAIKDAMKHVQVKCIMD